MTNENAVIRLLAMGHAARIAVLRLLAYAPEGMMSSALAEAVGIPRNGMSPHLKVLAEAGLIKASKAGRTVTYTLIQDALQDVAAFVGDISRPEAAVRS